MIQDGDESKKRDKAEGAKAGGEVGMQSGVAGTSGGIARVDMHWGPTHCFCMSWKTLTLDEEAYDLMKQAKLPRESFGDMVRRVFLEKDTDPSDLVDDLFREYGGKGMMSSSNRVRVAKAQASPARSSRPARRIGHAV